ncbi:hypothetical protein BHE74_00005937 [Ensete ventricosum]|nr:hypothetical protein BHE74_00005937 [Ensete ventricosum]
MSDRHGRGKADLAWGWPTYRARVTCRSKGRNPTHCIIGHRTITIRSQDQERSCHDRVRIKCDMPICDTDNHRRTTVALNIRAGGITNIDDKAHLTTKLAAHGGSPGPDKDNSKVIKTKDECGENPLSGSPFILEIQDRPIPYYFQLPMLEAYNGGSDPMEHVVMFRAHIALYGTRLPPTSIYSFDQLVKEFEANFLASACPKPTVASLLVMRQKEDEPLGPYLTRFVKEIRAIPDTHPSLIIQTFIIRIRPSRLFWLLVERTPTIVSKMLQRANQYVTTKTLVAEKCEDEKQPQVEFSRGPPPLLPRKRTERAE